jgi:hypothetical protein
VLDEDLFIYEETIRGSLPFRIEQNLGDVTLRLLLHYQACDDVSCSPPTIIALELPLAAEDNIRD